MTFKDKAGRSPGVLPRVHVNISLLIYEVEHTIDIQKRSSLSYLFSGVMYNLNYTNNYRNKTLKTTFCNLHIRFLNSDFSVDNALNVTKLLWHVL